MDVVLSWSGGKDAAFARRELEREGHRIVELLTTYSAETGRTGIHGLRPELVERQAAALSTPLRLVELPGASNDAYERAMRDALAETPAEAEAVAYADLFLEDVREYRESLLTEAGVDGVWPLWGRDTAELARAFVDAGFRARLVAVDGEALSASFLGRAFDRSLLSDLPEGVDPCGENGEFHTFVFDGPGFDSSVDHDVGETVTREVGDGVFHYVDLR